MNKNTQASSAPLPPFETGQVWQMDESTLQIGLIGKTRQAKREIEAIMAELPQFKLAKVLIMFRAAFTHASSEGRIVHEMSRRDTKACSEVTFLHDELFGRVGEGA